MRQGQFFIVTIILVTITITITALSLYVPKEINVNRMAINEKSITNALFVKQTISKISDYFKTNWLMPYTHRSVIKTENNFTLMDNTLIAAIDLPDNAYNNSLQLVDANNNNVPFNVEWNNLTARMGTIYFESSADALENKDYYLYYNVAPGKTIKNEQEQLFLYGEESNSFWVRTGSYYVNISKSNGGSIKVMNNSGSNDLLLSIDDFIKCGAQYNLTTASNKHVVITNNGYYLKAVFTGSRFTNESYEVTELFLPDRIIIIDKMTLAYNSACTEWGSMLSVVNDSLMNYADSNNNAFEPVDAQGITFVNNGDWVELHGSGYGIAMVTGNTSPIYSSANTDENRAELIFTSGATISKGTYFANITIIPLNNVRLNKTKQYSQPRITVTNEVFATEFNNLFNLTNKYFYDLNALVVFNKSAGVFHEQFTNLSGWYNNYSVRSQLFVMGPQRVIPFEPLVRLMNNVSFSSIILYDNGQANAQVSTNNYHDNAIFSSHLNNTELNNSLLILSPSGHDFNITVIKEVDGTAGAMVYLPNGSLINYYDISSTPYEIKLNGFNQSGFYNITFNGTAGISVNTTLPKIVSGLPLAVTSANNIYLFINESLNITGLEVITYSDTEQKFTLFDEFNNTIKTITNAGSINVDITPCVGGCYYRLEVNTSGPFKLSSTNRIYVATDEKYLINPLEPMISLVSVNMLSASKDLSVYYDLGANTSPVISASDLVYSKINNEVNNSKFSFDLDAMSFEYQDVDWLDNRGWVTCTDECTNSFSSIRFVETGSERVVVWANTSVGVDYYFHFYPNISYFKVITNATTNYSFGPAWRINNTNDLYYSFKNSKSILINGENKFISKYNLTGPFNYAMKNDEISKASVLFNINTLEYNNSIKLNATAIIITASIPGTFGFLINEEPSDYLTPVTINQQGLNINYTFDDSLLMFKGSLFT